MGIVLPTRRFYKKGRNFYHFRVRSTKRLRARFIAQFNVFLFIRSKLRLQFKEALRVMSVTFLNQACLIATCVATIQAPFGPAQMMVADHSIITWHFFVPSIHITSVCVIVLSVNLTLTVKQRRELYTFFIVRFRPVT